MVVNKIELILLLMMLTSQIDAKPPNIRGKMVKLLNTCFSDRLENVITTSDFGDILHEASWNSKQPRTQLIDDYLKSDDIQPRLSHSSTFIFAPRSIKSFEFILLIVESSPWWHIDSLFLIIGDLIEGCKPAAEILKRIREKNVSTSLFVCYEEESGVMLFTYNPHKNFIPYPWKEVETIDSPDDSWKLYAQEYFEGSENCASLTFKKTEINNAKYLETDDHDIFVPVTYPTDFHHLDPSIYQYEPDMNCCEYEIDEFPVSCIEHENHALDPGHNYELCRRNFLLEKKNCCYKSRLIEAGLHEYLRDQQINVPLQKSRNRQKEKTSLQYRLHKINDLAFTLGMLAIVLVAMILAVMIGAFRW